MTDCVPRDQRPRPRRKIIANTRDVGFGGGGHGCAATSAAKTWTGLNSLTPALRFPDMEAARVLPMLVADYLAFEESSEIRHEYVGGEIHVMSGATAAHNRISGNIYSALRARLRGGPCQVFIETFKVRLEVSGEEIFYYPDVVVTCHPSGIERLFLRFPTLVFEILSPSTETIDRREKHMSYRQAQTLEEYVIVSQERREVTVFRRADGWAAATFTAPESEVEFSSVKQTMTLAEIYEDVVFAP